MALPTWVLSAERQSVKISHKPLHNLPGYNWSLWVLWCFARVLVLFLNLKTSKTGLKIVVLYELCHRSTSMYQRFVVLLCLCISHHSCCWIMWSPPWLLFLSFVSLSWLSSLQHKGWQCRRFRCYRLHCCSLSSGTVLLPSSPLLCLPLPLMLCVLIRHNSMCTWVNQILILGRRA